MAGERTEWADFFNGLASQYEQYGFTHNTRAEADFLVEVMGIAPGAAILDVGCGTGRHSIELARRGFCMTGLDVSAGMLCEARRRAEIAKVSVNWIEADATSFSMREPFDAAICLCEGAFGLLGTSHNPILQPLSILRNIALALHPGAPCLFTVLNGYRMARQHTPEDVASGKFDPMSLAERSELAPSGDWAVSPLRERGFVPTELTLLFSAAGFEIDHIWGGTAGNWGRRPIDLDEMEIMVVARRAAGE